MHYSNLLQLMTAYDNVIIDCRQFTNNSAVVVSGLTNLLVVDCGIVNQDLVIELIILGHA